MAEINRKRASIAGATGVLVVAVQVGGLPLDQPSDGGLLVPLTLLGTLVVTLCLVTVLVFVGASVIGRLRAGPPPGVLGICLSLVVGSGILGAALCLLGFVGWYQPTPLAALLALSGVIGFFDAGSIPRFSLRKLVRNVQIPVWVLLVHGVFALLLAVIAVAPVSDWDSLMYHLSLPQSFLDEGRMFAPSDNPHFALVGVTHMLFLVLQAAGAPQGPMFLNVIAVLLTVLLVGSMAYRLRGRGAAMVSSLLVWSVTGISLVGASARSDALLILAVLVVHESVLRLLNRADERLGLAAGFAAGTSIGIKYQAAPYLVGVGVIMVWRMLLDNRRVVRRVLVPSIAVAAAIWVIWPLKNLIYLENPFAFLVGPIAIPGWLADLGGLATSVPLRSPLGEARLRFNFLDWVIAPGPLTVESSGYLQGLPVVVACGALFALRPIGMKAWSLLVVPPVVHVGLIIGRSPTTNLRYLFPAVVVLVALAGCGLSYLADLVPSLGRYVVAGAVVISLVSTAQWGINRAVVATDLHLSVGAVTKDHWLTASGNVELERLTDMGDWVQGSDPGKILALYEAREHALRFDFIQDNILLNWQYLEAVLGGQCLTAGSLNYVLVNERTRAYYIDRGVRPQTLRIDEFDDFAARCLSSPIRRDGYALYEVLP